MYIITCNTYKETHGIIFFILNFLRLKWPLLRLFLTSPQKKKPKKTAAPIQFVLPPSNEDF